MNQSESWSKNLANSNKLQLAVALAQGSSISAWARANDVAKETARRWAREPEVRAEIEAFRRRAIDRAVGVFARRGLGCQRDLQARRWC